LRSELCVPVAFEAEGQTDHVSIPSDRTLQVRHVHDRVVDPPDPSALGRPRITICQFNRQPGRVPATAVMWVMPDMPVVLPSLWKTEILDERRPRSPGA